MTEKYPTARVELALKDSYYNMLEQIRLHAPHRQCEKGLRGGGRTVV